MIWGITFLIYNVLPFKVTYFGHLIIIIFLSTSHIHTLVDRVQKASHDALLASM